MPAPGKGDMPDFKTIHMIQSGGVSLGPTTADAYNISKGKTAYNGDGELITGTYSLPSVNVTDDKMMMGTTAIDSSGSVVYGSIANKGSIYASLSPGGSKYFSAGYYSGGAVYGNTLPATTASTSDILSGKKANNESGSSITGTMPNNGSISATLNPGGSKYYSAGYYSGGTVACNSATSAIKYTNIGISGTNGSGSPLSGSVGGTIIGITSMDNGSGEPTSISVSGGTLYVYWTRNGRFSHTFRVAYI